MIVLDTHAWIWFIDQSELLSDTARLAIEGARAEKSIFVSSISAWEIYMLVQRGRITMATDPDTWIARCERFSFLKLIPVDNEIAKLSVRLPDPFHADPADRIIVATARFLGAPLVSRDEKILNYSHVKTIW